MAASCFIFKCHLIVTFALIVAETGLIVNKIQSFARTVVIDTDNINERACTTIQLFYTHYRIVTSSGF